MTSLLKVPATATFALLLALAVAPASAIRIQTNPPTSDVAPTFTFGNLAITPDGNTIVATGRFNAALADQEAVYSLPIPANPATQTATVTQLSTVAASFTVPDAPVISPNGQTVLAVHDAGTGTDTIHTFPIGGEGLFDPPTGFFGGANNSVSPGFANFDPRYSSDGQTIFFVNGNAGFGGTVPDFEAVGSPTTYGDADWDLLYSVPAGGGPATAITAPGDGDIDAGLFALTPNGNSIVFAPDVPLSTTSSRNNRRTTLASIPVTGGTATQISFPAPAHSFSIEDKIDVTPDGQSVLFLADYARQGQVELFSVPIGGGTPTRLNSDLHFAGNVTFFEIAPDGNSVAYVAGKSVGSASELFLKDLGSATPSVRISDPAADNSGRGVARTAAGPVVFSPDSSEVYYLGDFDTSGVDDLYVVDTTAKAGASASAYTYVGPDGGDFFDESNWEDATGANPPIDSIDEVGTNFRSSIDLNLLIDGNLIGGNKAVTWETDNVIRFREGSSLELINGADVSFPDISPGDDIGALVRFLPGSALRIENSSLTVSETIELDTLILEGGTIEAEGIVEDVDIDGVITPVPAAGNVRFFPGFDAIVDGGTITARDELYFDDGGVRLENVVLDAFDFGIRFESDITLVDSVLSVGGADPLTGGVSPVQDTAEVANGEGTVLTLEGASTLFASAVIEGIDLVLDGDSVATLTGFDTDEDDMVVENLILDDDGSSTITLASVDAELVIETAISTPNEPSFDARDVIINGLTGLSYADDPTAWNVTNWDGVSALASLRLAAAPLPGDYNNDGFVNAADYTIWRDGGPLQNETAAPIGVINQADYDEWAGNYGASNVSAVATPEPVGATIAAVGLLLTGLTTRRRNTDHG